MNSTKKSNIIILLGIFVAFIACSEKKSKILLTPQNKIITYETLHLQGKGWGYIIYIDGIEMIYQQAIPAVQGLYFFDTEQKAAITADFVARKLTRTNDFPYVTTEILDSLGVLTPEIIANQK